MVSTLVLSVFILLQGKKIKDFTLSNWFINIRGYFLVRVKISERRKSCYQKLSKFGFLKGLFSFESLYVSLLLLHLPSSSVSPTKINLQKLATLYFILCLL